MPCVVVLEESSSRRCGTKEGLLVIGCFVVLYFVVAVVEEELVVAERWWCSTRALLKGRIDNSMADIVVTVAVVVCRIPSGTPGSRYQSLRKKCNRIVRSSGSKSMSSSKSLLISDQLVFWDDYWDDRFRHTYTRVWDTYAHTHTYAYAHGKWFTTGCSDFGSSVCAVFHDFHFFGQNRVRDKIAYLRPWFGNGNGVYHFVLVVVVFFFFLRFVCSFFDVGT